VIGESEAAEGVVALKDLRAEAGGSADGRVDPDHLSSLIRAQAHA
jgi:hypothetical protein